MDVNANLLIRADGSSRIGTGHVMRCLALAQGWQHIGGKVTFAQAETTPALEQRLGGEGIEAVRLNVVSGSSDDAVQTVALAGALGANWVVADGYCFGAAWQRQIKEAGFRLLLWDDYGHAKHYFADLILNQNLNADANLYAHRELYSNLLLGTRYVQLRREFLAWRNWQRAIAPVARNVLVTLGGSDPDNVTGKVIQALSRMRDLEAVIVAGSSNPNLEALQSAIAECSFPIRLEVASANMPELMAWADVAVSAAGSTSWELAFMGLPSIVNVLSENQFYIAAALSREGVSLSLGEHATLSIGQIAAALQSLCTNFALREQMSRHSRELVDGVGAQRIMRLLVPRENEETNDFGKDTIERVSRAESVLSESSAMPRSVTVSVVVDNPRSWFVPFAQRLVERLEAFGNVKFLHSAQEIPEGNTVAFLLSYETKVPPPILDRSQHNIVVHASDLPEGKGMSPLTWQILEGNNVIPLSLFEAVEAIDAGAIYLKDSVRFQGNELIDEMHAVLGWKIVDMCEHFMVKYPGIIAQGRAQIGSGTFYRRRKASDSRLDPNKTIADQFNLLRVVDNERYPAFFEWKGRKFLLKISPMYDNPST